MKNLAAEHGLKAMKPILPDQVAPERTRFIPRARRLWLLSALVLLGLVAVTMIYVRQGVPDLGTDDFVEYWAAGRLNLTGDDPYGADELFALQLQVGWDESAPLMMWNPPPVLTLVMPFGLLSYSVARWWWLVTNVVLVVGCVGVLWRLYGGKFQQYLWGVLALLCFVPTVMVLHIGQIGIWVLVAFVGFLVFAERKAWGAAGALLVLGILKPHVAYLVWAALGLWWLRQRHWRVAGGFLSVLALAWLIPTLINPPVTGQYLEAVRTAPPLYWITTTFGAYLRQWFGWQREWLQFVPSLMGLGWLVWYWPRRAATWDWKAEMPLLLLVSATTMSFGWPFDLVVLLPAVIQMTIWVLADTSAWYRIGMLFFYAVVNGVALWQLQSGVGADQYVWFAPTLLLAFLLVRARHRQPLAMRVAQPQGL
jgi:hypothetical protein